MRLCRAKGGRAIFHQWGERADIIPPSPMVGGHGGGVLKYSTAIVEYENGQTTEVMANDVVFQDTEQVMRRLQEETAHE